MARPAYFRSLISYAATVVVINTNSPFQRAFFDWASNDTPNGSIIMK